MLDPLPGLLRRWMAWRQRPRSYSGALIIVSVNLNKD